MNLSDLRKSPLFQGLSDEQLQQLVDMAEPVTLTAGQVLIQQGDLGDAAFVVMSGEFQIEKKTGQSIVKIAVRNAGDVVGEMALLARAPRSASVTALTTGEVLRIPQQAFENLIASSPGASLAILNWVMARLLQNEALLHQQEKMAALGTMSAGLAHELNNPAAAAQRSAADMSAAVLNWQALTRQLEGAAFEAGKREWFSQFVQHSEARLQTPLKLEALDKIDLVDQLQAWLEAQEVESAWELAPAMVRFGWGIKSIEEVKRGLDSSLFGLAVKWLGAGCLMMELLFEVRETTERISQIVHAVKSYAYLDQAPVLEVDLHEGLENTVVIMQHKLKKGVTLKREYAPNLPRIQAYASELNQVWTNIIDNAVDAMDGHGEITLRTFEEAGNVVVEIEDNGAGIPEAIRLRIFEPFFTTKGVGKGTGLGLHISHDIVVNRHRGQLSVESQPGRTKFKIVLPKHIQGA